MEKNSKQPYQICTRCVMDTTDPWITFNEVGLCNHCVEFFELAPLYVYNGEKSDKALAELVKKIKKDGEGKPYDCIVGVSGGVDSTYVAYITKQLGLRALTVHFDNGWNSELAVKNIENIVKKLEFDYQTYVVDWEEFKDLQIAFLKASVANAEIPSDHAFLAALYNIANKYGIKYLLSGSNFATEGILPNSWGYNAKDIKQLRGIHRLFGKKKLKTYPTLGFYKEFYYTYAKQIKTIRLLNYVPYHKEQAMKVIQDKLGWVYYGGKHYESVFTRFFQSYILPRKFHIDKRKAHLSTLICNGEITRDQALAELEKETYPAHQIKEDREYVIKKLDLTEQEFEDIMNAPIKSYSDYPNNEKMLKFIYSIYYKLRGRR